MFYVLQRLFLVAVIAFLMPVGLLSANPLARLEPDEAAAFSRFEKAIRLWDGDEASLLELKADMERFAARHADFAPIQVLAARVEWIRISQGMGQVHASRSFLPVFVELQKMAPDYPQAFIQTARAYIIASDFEGALPSLKAAERLSPEDPWVDLAWALLHDRKREGQDAAERARAAIGKAKGDVVAMANAAITIARHNGVASIGAVEALADDICVVQCDPAFLVSVIERIVDRYAYQPGLLELTAVLANRAAEQETPAPALLLQWARAAMLGGNLHQVGAIARFDPRFAFAAEEILLSIKDEPEVAEEVWGHLIDIALSKGDLSRAEAMIGEGRDRGYPMAKIGRKAAALLYAEEKPARSLTLYRELNLPEDSLYAEALARTGDFDAARRYHHGLAEDNPTNPYTLGNYAGFLLFYVADVEQAIWFGTRAYELAPYPLAGQTLAAAYLSLSGQRLKSGQLNLALDAYRSADDLGFDRDFVMTLCWRTCEEVTAAITAFD